MKKPIMQQWKYFYLTFTFIIMVSCNYKSTKQVAVLSKQIKVTFWKGNIDITHRIDCNSFAKWDKSKYDTIYIDKITFSKIEKHVRDLIPTKGDSNCDFRMHVQMDSIQLCFDLFNCIAKNNVKMIVDDSLIYLIRKNSAYYNYLRRDVLKKLSEIKKFGIPKEYLFKIRDFHEDEISRVVLVQR